MAEEMFVVTTEKGQHHAYTKNVLLTDKMDVGNLTVDVSPDNRKSFTISGTDPVRGDEISILEARGQSLVVVRNFKRLIQLRNFLERPDTITVILRPGQFLRISTQTLDTQITATLPWTR